MTVFCAICGAPIVYVGAFENLPEWLTSATLIHRDDLTQQNDETPNPIVVTTPAIYEDDGQFQVSLPSRSFAITAYDVASWTRPNPPLYIPIHARCLSMVATVAATFDTSIQRALDRVWQVLLGRFQSDSKGRWRSLLQLCELNGYYGIFKFQSIEWEPGSDGSKLYEESEYFVADPVEIPDLDTTLLKNLQPLPDEVASRLDSTNRKQLVTPLSRSTLQLIKTQLQAHPSSPRSCSYEIPAVCWKAALLENSLLPWLPQMNPDISAIEEEYFKADTTEWDWEDLVRRLWSLHFETGPMTMVENGPKVPAGLWNRRRIWQLIEDILAI